MLPRLKSNLYFNLLLIVAGMLLHIVVAAQKNTLHSFNDLRFENFNASNRFTNQYIQSLTVDSSGYVWAGANGLLRFDGVNVTTYNSFKNERHHLADDYIDEVIVDAQKRLWVGSGRGLQVYDERLNVFVFPKIKNGATRPEFAFRLKLDGDTLWFFSQLGLQGVDIKTSTVFDTRATEVFEPTVAAVINDSLLWLHGMSSGSLFYNKQNGSVQRHPFFTADKNIRIWSIESVGKKLYIGTTTGVYVQDGIYGEVKKVKQFGNLHVTQLLKAPALSGEHKLWIGTFNHGLFLYDVNSVVESQSFANNPFNPYSLQGNSVSCLHLDAGNRLWVGTQNGVSLLDMNSQQSKVFVLPAHGPINTTRYVNQVIPDKQHPELVYICSQGNGILSYNWAKKTALKHYTTLGNADINDWRVAVQDMEYLHDDEWLVAKRDELLQWNTRTNTAHSIDIKGNNENPVKVAVRDLVPGVNGNIYLLTYTGLYKLKNDRISPIYVPERDEENVYPGMMVSGAYDSVSQKLFCASRSGLVELNTVTGVITVWRNTSPSDNLNKNFLFHIDYRRDTVFCSTRAGFSLFDVKRKTFTTISKFGDVKSPQCFGSKVIGSDVFINCSAGLIRYNLLSQQQFPVTLGTPVTETYSYSPPFYVGNELAVGYRTAIGYMQLPLHNGDNVSVARIEEIRVNGRTILPVNAVRNLPYHKNNIAFSITAFNYNHPSDVRFRYRLAGANPVWQLSRGERNIGFNNLAPGSYRFEVQSGSYDFTKRPVTAFAFTISPPYWRTWWFNLLLICVFLATVFFIAYRRLKRFEERERLKARITAEKAELEMKALRSQMNPHFIFNSLNSIQKYIWENKQEDAAEYLTKFSRLIRSILNNSMHALVTVEEELSLIKLYIELEHRRSNQKFDYTIDVDEKVSLSNVMMPPLILQPHIENAIWHGLNNLERRGFLKVTISLEDEFLLCVVEDDGVGRQVAAQLRKTDHVPLGLQNSERRLLLLANERHLHGSISITDKSNPHNDAAGTLVTLRIPLVYRKHL